MHLGAFSIGLSVKNLAASRAFYETLGFSVFGGQAEQNWLIMKNGDAIIGLFQGMFQGNMLTFNPGWNQNAQSVDPFDDVRSIQTQLQAAGIALQVEVDNSTTGPAHIVVTDPDGNTILIDQHR